MARIFQAGVGSGGIVVLDLLSRDPQITHATIVDPDVYQPHNVIRHRFPRSSVGTLKVTLANEFVTRHRPDFTITERPVDLLDGNSQEQLRGDAAACDLGICAVDREPAKFQFDALMREAGKPWTLGEVLSGGIGGWVHTFPPEGPCYACLSSQLNRELPADPTPVDYSQPSGPEPTTIPASATSIHAIASWHASISRDLLQRHPLPFTSLLIPFTTLPGLTNEPYQPIPYHFSKLPACLICSVPSSRDRDLAQALSRLSDGQATD